MADKQRERIVNPDAGNAAAVQPEPRVPEKFSGKSAEDIARSYEELERKLGAQSEKIRQLESANVSLVDAHRQQSAETPNEFDWDDPVSAIERSVEKAMRPYAEMVGKAQEQAFINRLNQEHSGWQDSVQNEEFARFISEDPVRVRLYQQAQQLDYDAANSLLRQFEKESRQEEAAEAAASNALRNEAQLRAASTETGGIGVGDKIIRRQDIIDLKMRNPNRYDAMLPEIKRAYAEGRVR